VAGLAARARQDIARLTGVLYEDARYAGEIRITLAGRPLDSVGPFDEIPARPVPVEIVVDPGPVFVFGQVDAAPLPPGVALRDLGLVPGRPASSAVIVAAETEIVDAWRRQGHP